MGYVIVYLVAIVAANLSVAYFGAWITPITAFLFIGLDITTRDSLHDKWEHKNLLLKMGLLISAGSILSWVLNRNAGQIALASFVAFGVSSVIDAIVYHKVKASNFEKVNWSNLASGAIDSILFPAIAFGWPPSMEIVYGQATAKIAGGLFWSLILIRFKR